MLIHMRWACMSVRATSKLVHKVARSVGLRRQVSEEREPVSYDLRYDSKPRTANFKLGVVTR